MVHTVVFVFKKLIFCFKIFVKDHYINVSKYIYGFKNNEKNNAAKFKLCSKDQLS